MADARVVSNRLIDLASAAGDTLTPMQVLKLVYIAHGYSLGARGVPLIPNRVEAWKFGPVIPTLYHSIKHWRDKPVGQIVTTGLEDFRDGEREIVDAIYEAYKGLDGIALSNLTHQLGTPWAEVYRPDRANIPIPDDLIQHHYKGILDAQ
ncbi:type II toxin-antitoxin system antitoxin SocA domain-containing protein [Mesobacterium sp. TK19101]|uniref:Type II toxin-antitoxin system antitoxin SocA domain-containing protein n=1 Tax=Mesobacterium hydrothermale TaxID=3111907 RepID=A0ABU6HLA8_9RHOB|nr:type II toxin-antitoxin system antitoxin SocA domain-containing protein [Mesobacterium sp. TK19101]MEC3863238.1 type II toxin-antitoxin system antitoxin SocA domain-containing protein [Mesobacterium sp. TK19101]